MMLKRLAAGVLAPLIFLTGLSTLALAWMWNTLMGVGHRNFGPFQELGLFVGAIALIVFAFRFIHFAFCGRVRAKAQIRG